MRRTPSKKIYRRWLVILLAMRGRPAAEISDIAGVSPSSIYQWVRRYNRSGPEALAMGASGGRRHAILSPEEEIALMLAFKRRLAGRKVVSMIPEIRDFVESWVGRRVSKDFLYDLLRRQGWRKSRFPASRESVGPRRRYWKPPS